MRPSITSVCAFVLTLALALLTEHRAGEVGYYRGDTRSSAQVTLG